ncbi:sensor histidine kinase [Pseudomonas sp. CGJS7]|uniref:sensor histidine kinase n=1 Tax=Pseudomonas sp. CGJS7 TaxID=3109348 RepID=UPI00300A0A21
MPSTVSAPSIPPRGLARVFGRRRVFAVALASIAVAGFAKLSSVVSYWELLARMATVGLACLLVFGLFERWPARLPRWVGRWALQVIAVAAVVPFAAVFAYHWTTYYDPKPWWTDNDRLSGFGMLLAISLLVAPWMAISALLRQIRGQAQQQALAFELERSRYERAALDARLRLLQAQVEPHFLFNTLANVRELVQSGSPQASAVLESLIAYLRAAVPRLHRDQSTLAQELELVRAYLEVMHMRMPDRLEFGLHADPDTLELECPPTALLTLVENAVRHGIDPSEEGGRIDIFVRAHAGRCHVEVRDGGVGLGDTGASLGTGLANLRERLHLAFDGDARLSLSPLHPRGTSASLEFPARSPS